MHQPAFGVLLEAWFVVTCEQHVRNHRMIFCTFFLFVGTSTAHTIHIVAPLRCRAGCIWGYCCPYISVTMCDKRLSRLEGNSCPSSISFSVLEDKLSTPHHPRSLARPMVQGVPAQVSWRCCAVPSRGQLSCNKSRVPRSYRVTQGAVLCCDGGRSNVLNCCAGATRTTMVL